MEIKILGPGCVRCKQTEEMVRNTVAEADIAADIEKVTDIKKIAQYGVFGTPAVVVNGKVKSVGKIPKKEEILAWLTEAAKEWAVKGKAKLDLPDSYARLIKDRGDIMSIFTAATVAGWWRGVDGPIGRIGEPLYNGAYSRFQEKGITLVIQQELLDNLPEEGGELQFMMGD